MTDRLRGPVIAITGPTASGKSALADAVAAALDTAVISCDAMQVYRGMDIGTAKVPASKRLAPLKMIDVVDVGCTYSVALYQAQARSCIDALLASKKAAILCGGTGLYLDALVDEMDFPHGELHSETRAYWETFAREHGAESLHAALCERDAPSAALIHPHNVRRVIRALELLEENKSYAEHHQGLRSHTPHYDAVLWAISMERTRLYTRIDERVDTMFEQGFVDEVRRLEKRGLRQAHTASQAIGYREVLRYLDGELSLVDTREAIKQRTRHYAKRQLSWLRRDGRVRWLDFDRIDLQMAKERILEESFSRTLEQES